jgi:hypothetical protein
VILLLTFVEAISAQVSAGEDWAAPARAFVKKIADRLKPGQVVTFSLQNLSSISPDRIAQVQTAIDTELRVQGLGLKKNGRKTPTATEEAVGEVRVTLSENTQGFLWVAEIVAADEHQVVMQLVPRAPARVGSTNIPTMLLRSQKLFEREEPILDFVQVEIPVGSAMRLLTLEPARIALHSTNQGDWQLIEAADLPAPNPPHRDLKGHLSTFGDTFSAILDGVSCRGQVRDALAINCDTTVLARRPWNEQSGVNWPGTFPAVQRDIASYSIAKFEVKGKWVEIAAGTDGISRLYRPDQVKGPIASFSGWGSELAAVKTGCGSGWQILVTRAGDYTERDAIQAFEIVDKKAEAVSPPLEFAGPVMTLHASEGSDTGLAVVRDLNTGKYEAHVVSLSCAR